MMKTHTLVISLLLMFSSSIMAGDISLNLKITKQYLNIPVSHKVDRSKMSFEINGKQEREFVIRLAPSEPDYWVFCDVSAYKGKTIKIYYEGNSEGLSKIYQADEIEGQADLYKEEKRPQLHFSSNRGWINDPNGLIYYEGEYHLFFQHNPYERDWENMHWGHAVSKDMIHWQQLPEALYPDRLGTMFSGTAVIDYDNTSGFGKKGNPAMIAAYTAFSPEKQVQCIAYSLDKGRTWTKYEGNPVIDSKSKWNSVDTRDPKIFWHTPSGHWVMVLNERDGHSIYTSGNLKEWTYQSHVPGFWECPELFELPVDGNSQNTKWVMYGASGTYMLGQFDGKVFTPQSGKFYYGKTGYAGQTFANIPESDGRRIQIAWARLATYGEHSFNHMMLLPTEFTLRTTKNGVRLFSAPVKEIETLEGNKKQCNNVSADKANEFLQEFKELEYFRIRTTIKLSHATSAGLSLHGQNLLDYDMNANLVNGTFYSPDDMTSMEITADIIVDRTSVEAFIDGGAYSYAIDRRSDANNRDGLRFWGNNIEVKELKICPMESIW